MLLRRLLQKITCKSNLDDTGKQNLFACVVTAFHLCCLLQAKGTDEPFPSFLEEGKAGSTSGFSKYVCKGLISPANTDQRGDAFFF